MLDSRGFTDCKAKFNLVPSLFYVDLSSDCVKQYSTGLRCGANGGVNLSVTDMLSANSLKLNIPFF